MVRRWLGFLCWLPLSLSVGCGGLSVTPYIGTVVQMSWAGAGITPAGQHLELWTRDKYNDIIRVDGSYTFEDRKTKNTKTIYTLGLQIRNSVTFDDPCMIDDKGNLLTSPDAYKTLKVGSLTETPEEQAQAVKNRIAQLTSQALGGNEASTLLVVTPFDDTPEPILSATATAADRLQACTDYWDASPLAYTPNPAQSTHPLNGAAYGFVAFTTTTPPSGYDGIRIDSPTNLEGTQELWVSVETASLANVNAAEQGPVFLDSTPTPGGQDVIHFDLTGPSASGTAALLINLDDSSVLF